MDIKKITHLIVEKYTDILSNLDPESVSVYLFLKDEYEKGGINDNFVFKFVFRSFYRLDNAGLTDEFKKIFFNLLDYKQTDLKYILLRLYEIPTLKNKNTIQFSFATKLIHTVDNNAPIYDLNVGKIISKIVSGKNRDEKIQSCLEIYNSLKELYEKLLENEDIKKVILNFRSKFNVDTERMTGPKILDFIFWSLGQIKTIKISKLK